jgi:mannosyltransferase OCH1-like enzyme
MAIPKVIYQTYKTKRIPWLIRLYIRLFMWKNKGYRYEFYDDGRIDRFIREEYPPVVHEAYSRLQIGAAKADFFRYAILYKYGGIYLDLDGRILVNLDKYLKDSDSAILSKEKSTGIFYSQWALIYDKQHPFLRRTLHYLLRNIQQNRYPHNIHALSGPRVYTQAVTDEIKCNPQVSFRLIAPDYDGMMQYHVPFSRLLIYRGYAGHWRRMQQVMPAYKAEEQE